MAWQGTPAGGAEESTRAARAHALWYVVSTVTQQGFYRRPLPPSLVAFASDEGRALFREALREGHLEGWFALAEQFQTQAEPSFCGLGTLVVALNALGIDPGRVWKGPWRWYSEELLDCCLPLDAVRAHGLTLGQFACLARCNGAAAEVHRADTSSIEEFRGALEAAASTPDGLVVAVSYARAALGQTGDGHFSPVAGLHATRDLALVLDVARFKYPPHWVPVDALWNAMLPPDPVTGKPRGWVVLRRRPTTASAMFRMTDANIPWIDIARRLLVDAPAALRRALPATARDAVASLVAGLAPQAASLLVELPRSLDHLPQAHAEQAQALLAELRAAPLFRLVTELLNVAPSASDVHPAELVTVLVLALPDRVLAELPEPAATELASLRDITPRDGALWAEIDTLREQISALGDANPSCQAGPPLGGSALA